MTARLFQSLSAGVLGFALLGLSLPAQPQERGSSLLKEAKRRSKENLGSSPRIVGGDDTDIQDNPWQVGLLDADNKTDYLNAQFCGGSVVHPRWILTAAHCVDNGTLPEDIEILSGTHLLARNTGRRTAVEAIIVHPQWQGARNHDIALVKLKNAIADTPIALATDNSLLIPGAKIWVSGWGLQQQGGSKATVHLQGVSLDFIAQGQRTGECNSPASYNGRVTDTMFCAGHADSSGGGGKDSCQGDSGGPASIGEVESARLVGVVSWGDGCAIAYKYGVYTRVPSYLDWISKASNGAIKR